MLVNPEFKYDLAVMGMLSLMGQGGQPKEIEQGIFESPSFSMGNFIANNKENYFDFDSPEHEYLGAYGVCDNINQVKEKYENWFSRPDLKFCVSFTSVKKAEQESEGGWRWHKWGEYIGTKNPQHEYLYDEGEDINEVFVYHIYQLLD